MTKSSKMRRTGSRPPKFTLGLPSKIVDSRTSKAGKLRKAKGIQEVRVWGATSDLSDTVEPKNHRIKRVRNPWSPETIQQLVAVIVLSSPIWTEAIGWLKAWMKFRGQREFRIRVRGNELVVKGYMRTSELERIFKEFSRQLKGASRADIRVTLPKGVSRSFPRELTTKQGRKKK